MTVLVFHANGNVSRVHETLITRGSPKRLRRTFVAGLGLESWWQSHFSGNAFDGGHESYWGGIAKCGGCCFDSFSEAMACVRSVNARRAP